MRILAIETSCDETAVAIVEANGSFEDASFHILGNALLSQAKLHEEYGGVFPTLAKREHQKNLVPLLIEALTQAGMYAPKASTLEHALEDIYSNVLKNIRVDILGREPALFEEFGARVPKIQKPEIDAVVVTQGPGLEPALWVGINFAKALGMLWDVPVIPVNHMEGHIVSALLTRELTGDSLQVTGKATVMQAASYQLQAISLPLLALLISGGHTELVLMKEWLSYELVGETRDDAVGEAFDKVARMLELPYPGGPHISVHAAKHRETGNASAVTFPRPMLQDDTCDFSFSGLKTAVLYHLKKFPEITDDTRAEVARAFEDAVADVLVKKTARAIERHHPKTLVIGGGVSANAHLRSEFEKLVRNEYPDMTLRVPLKDLTGDNAVMIGAVGYLRSLAPQAENAELSARGNLRLSH